MPLFGLGFGLEQSFSQPLGFDAWVHFKLMLHRTKIIGAHFAEYLATSRAVSTHDLLVQHFLGDEESFGH